MEGSASQSGPVVFGPPTSAGGGRAPTLQPTPTSSYQTKEVVLYGTIIDPHLDLMIQRLKGLCDPGMIQFHEHEMVLSLRTGHDPDVTVRMRRKYKDVHHNVILANTWHMRYVGGPEPDVQCPAIVRKCIDSLVTTAPHTPMMDFVKSLGLRMDFEYLTKGHLFTKGNVKVIIEHIQKTEQPGSYKDHDLKLISEYHLITLTTSLPESADYNAAAKYLREFADQLTPLTVMEKTEYWKKNPHSL